MYYVLLVDDEENILQVLQDSIAWQDLGVEKLFTAQSGEKALELLEQNRIDLLITDIQMPGMDGISLIKQVRSLNSDIHCILLTAYSEFEYARQAISLGVDNYLLKPISKDEMEQTIYKALDNIYSHMNNGEDLLRENILNRWVRGIISEEELGERAAFLELNIYLPEYCALCITKKEGSSITSFRASCVAEIGEHYDVYHFWDEKGRYVLILGGRNIDTRKVMDTILRIALEQQVQEKIRVSVGEVVTEIGNLHLSYQLACDVAELSNLSSSGVILHKEEVFGGFDMDWSVEEVRFLFFAEESFVKDSGYEHFGMKVYQDIWSKETENTSVENKVLVWILQICMKVLVTEFPLRGNFQELIFGREWNLEIRQDKKTFITSMKQLLCEIQGIFDSCFADYSPIVQLTVTYIRNSVMSGACVSIKEFCAEKRMNSAYLGSIFKKETGFFFNDYLNQCRINRSIILLRNPNRKIKDIALDVGFASASYYVKCFRECKGVSPTKYRIGVGAGE